MAKKPQLNIELTEHRESILLFMAEETESYSTNGPTNGKPSAAAMLRRICEGQISLYYRGKKITVPAHMFFSSTAK